MEIIFNIIDGYGVVVTELSKKKWTIFYAWQSDSLMATNRRGIEVALSIAIANIVQDRDDVDFLIDEATRDVSGSPNIPDSIRQKILNADIFVGDVTTINPNSNDRRCPNPNVSFEVGYAAACLGWSRMILLANTNIAPLSDLPFDFDRQRITAYSLSDSDPSSFKSQRLQLAGTLTQAIATIVDHKPKTALELLGSSNEAIRRQRDVHNLKWILSKISIVNLQEHIEKLPRIITYADITFQIMFSSVAQSNAFHLYDDRLSSAFGDLDDAWSSALSYGAHYRDNDRGLHILSNPMDLPLDKNQKIVEEAVLAAAIRMRTSFDQILKIVREEYVEIDLSDTSKNAVLQLRDQ